MTAKAQKFALYWRKSKYFGGLCPPGIFTLSTERISFTTEEGTLFDVPHGNARITLSRWGTLTVHSSGSSWNLLATAGQDSRAFSRSQQRELGAAGARKPDPSAGTKPVRERAATLASRGMQVEIHRAVNLYVLYGVIALGVAASFAALLLLR